MQRGETSEKIAAWQAFLAAMGDEMPRNEKGHYNGRFFYAMLCAIKAYNDDNRIASGAPTRNEIADIVIEALSPAPDGPDAGPWAAADRILARIASGAGDGDRALHHAYLRLRAIMWNDIVACVRVIPGAFDTPRGPTSEQVWKTTEDALARALYPAVFLPAAHQGEPSDEQVRLAEMTYDSALWVAKVSREEAMRRALRIALSRGPDPVFS